MFGSSIHLRLSEVSGADKSIGQPPTANPTTNRGDDVGHKGGRPLVGRLPTGKGSRHLHRGDGDCVMMVKEG
ncbi:hypothetical protein BHM03_00006109 [Ensete ventricosum]|uniref:Uncharacterized protein n=1 Tax=Ensete ventricosum TaxID=4639 RepID=A0A445MBH1_ENSVE|nr:hypothetical protein BHM03_00006109 [Ensete ventricosum]